MRSNSCCTADISFSAAPGAPIRHCCNRSVTLGVSLGIVPFRILPFRIHGPF